MLVYCPFRLFVCVSVSNRGGVSRLVDFLVTFSKAGDETVRGV